MGEPAEEYRLIIHKAEESLRVARRDDAAGDHAFAASRAYYAAFHAIRAALKTQGLEPSKHSNTLGEFSRLFVKTGIFPREFGRLLNQLLRTRMIGDYKTSPPVSELDGRASIDVASRVIEAVKEYLAAEGFLPVK